jgi:hypothetical protein
MVVRMKSSLDFFASRIELTAIAGGEQGNAGARHDGRGLTLAHALGYVAQNKRPRPRSL